MKKLAIATSVVAVLAVCSTALAAATPSGTYKRNVHSAILKGALDGAWTVTLTNGKYTVTDKGMAVVHGKYTIKGSKITFKDTGGPDACPSPGIYRFKVSGKSVTLKRLSDSNPKCVGRATVVTGTFTKTG